MYPLEKIDAQILILLQLIGIGPKMQKEIEFIGHALSDHINFVN